MNWYKKAENQKQIWEMDPTGPEYSKLDIDTLDRMVFGFSRKDITRLSPNKLSIKWKDDLNNVIYEQENSGLSKEEWAKRINLTEPIDVIYEDGVFKVDDGHHRYYAALILGVDLNISLEIKDKPHRTAVMRALSEGKQIPFEVMRGYNELV